MMHKAANKVSWYFSIYNYGLSNWQITKLGNTSKAHLRVI